MPEPILIEASVQGRLNELQAERDANWSREDLDAHRAVRQSLVANADRAAFVKAGDTVPPFTLPEVDGGHVVLTELLETGPVVLIFFRFEGCPACNAAWSAYRVSLAPVLQQLGAHLVAISPQVPAKLIEFKRRHHHNFRVASDPEATLLHQFGIGFAPEESDRARMRSEGKDLGAILGAGLWELPYPTAIVIGQDRVVRFADIHPDWMVRTQSEDIIDAVRTLLAETPASAP